MRGRLAHVECRNTCIHSHRLCLSGGPIGRRLAGSMARRGDDTGLPAQPLRARRVVVATGSDTGHRTNPQRVP